jgi:hypothetical protein
MEEMTKVVLSVVSAVIVSLIGLALKGVFGAIMGFLLVLIAVGLFKIWKKYGD